MNSGRERIWFDLFYMAWCCDEQIIDGEIAQCKADAEAGNKRAQEYWAKFIIELMKG